MKFLKTISLSLMLGLGLSGCSLLGFKSKRPPEIVPSCFSDGENQELYCKSQRTSEEGKIVVTRCIGTQNKEAKPALRGKCVEKICTEGSNTDCVVKGEFAVLEQYAELVTSRLFVDDESQDSRAKKTAIAKEKYRKGAVSIAAGSSASMMSSVNMAPSSAETDGMEAGPTVASVAEGHAALEKTPEEEMSKAVTGSGAKKGGGGKSSPVKEELRKEAEAEAPATMSITLKPVKLPKKKARSLASVTGDESGYKKACVPKRQKGAPESLRGRCATRTCAGGKCIYKGRKEIFEWVARQEIKED